MSLLYQTFKFRSFLYSKMQPAYAVIVLLYAVSLVEKADFAYDLLANLKIKMQETKFSGKIASNLNFFGLYRI